jgi:HK97 family phage portal protein
LLNVMERIISRAKQDDSALYRLHPELRDRVHLLSLTANEQQVTPYGYQAAAADYAGHVWVHKAIRVIDNNVAHLPLRVLDRSGDERVGHPLTMLFSQVNETMSPPILWGQWVTDMMLGGESGLEFVRGSRGGTLEVWPRQPHQITVVTDADRKRYFGVAEYKIKVDATDKGFVVPREEFVHFKFYNPLNPWRGLAPITAVRMGIVIDQLAQAWARMFFANSARPDYALIAPQGITPSEREDMEEKLASKFGGVRGSHKPIILEEGITDIKTFSFAPKDMEWINQRELARDEIGAIFGVPDEIMGYGKDTYENLGKAMTLLWTLTLLPLLGFRDWTLTKHFQQIGQLRPDEHLATDTSSVKELQEDLTEKLGQGKLFFDMGYTPDQINDRLGLGMDASPVSALPFAGRPAPGQFGAPGQQDSTPARAMWRQVTKAAIPAYGSAEHIARR